MKILLLGNSQDLGAWFEGGKKRSEIVRERLMEEFATDVDIHVQAFWPNERMPELLGRWLVQVQPDMVYINVTAFPFAYESLPLRFKRVFGRMGPAMGDAGLRFAASERWAHNFLFRKARRFGQATIGGDTHFTCQEVVDRVCDSVRVALRGEAVFVAVEGPLGRGEPELTRRQRRRKEERRQLVHQALKEFCASVHVFYLGSDSPLPPERQHVSGETVGDGMHFNAAGHARLAEDLFENIREAWRSRLTPGAAGEGH